MKTAIRLLFAVSAAGVLLISSSCRSYPFEFADMCEFPDGTEPVICRKAAPSGYMVQANVVMENIFFSFSGIMMLRKQGENLSLAVMLPAGAKVLEASGKAARDIIMGLKLHLEGLSLEYPDYVTVTTEV